MSAKYLPHTTHGNSTDLHSEGKVTDPEDISERIYGVDNTDHSADALDENIPSSFGSHIRPVHLLSTETEEGSRIVDEETEEEKEEPISSRPRGLEGIKRKLIKHDDQTSKSPEEEKKKKKRRKKLRQKIRKEKRKTKHSHLTHRPLKTKKRGESTELKQLKETN